MPTKPEELRDRTKQFAIRIIRLYRALPKKTEAEIIGKQLLRSGTSVGANYRGACTARSRPEFIAKMGIVVEEASESIFWMELLSETGIVATGRLEPLLNEAKELAAIFGASRQTAKSRH
jgi:four helix bundle protein